MLGLKLNLSFRKESGLSKLFFPTNLPHPKPAVTFISLKLWVATIYSLVNKPVPAKSSNPIAKFGLLLFFDLYLNFTLNPLSRKCPATLSTSHLKSEGL